MKEQEIRFADDGSRQAMAAAVASADPAVEWRLGRLRRAQYRGNDPFRILEEIRTVRRAWPDDARLEALFDVGGVDGADVLRNYVSWPSAVYDSRELRRRPLFARLAREHPDVLVEVLWGAPQDADMVATALADLPADALNPIAASIADLACDTSKQRRRASVHLLRAVDAEAITPHLRRLAVEAPASTRAEALLAWGDVVGPDGLPAVIEFCDSHLANDRSAGVQNAIAKLREQARAGVAVSTPPWPDVDDPEPSDDERRVFEEILDRRYRAEMARYEYRVQRLRENPPSGGGKWPLAAAGPRPERIPDSLIEQAWEHACTGAKIAADTTPFRSVIKADDPILMRFGLVRMFRILRLAGFHRRFDAIFHQLADRYAATGRPTLLEVQAAAEAAGYTRDTVIAALPDNPRWERDHISDWVLAVLPSITEIITGADSWEFGRPDRYYAALTTLPELPPKLRHVLVEQAVGPRKGRRPLARLTLAAFPGAVQAAIGSLSSRRHSERAEAANWLAELGSSEAIPALRAAARNEPHDTALGAELSALVALGESIEPYLATDALLARAQGASPMPADGDWIPLDVLPPLRWQDGIEVDRAIVDWLVTQAVRVKTASASPVVRLVFQRMQRDTVAAFAHAIVTMWIQHDLQPISLAEATALAKSAAAWARREREFLDLDDEALLARMLARRIEQPAGSAVGSKGLLSLAAAGGDATVVAPAAAYVKKWFGRRASQSKALIEMLAWVDDPTAVQFVLSVGNRFRTKGIQAEALRQAELLAERNGWSVDELGLRMVPDGGFDADGRLTVDYGTRTFEAQLSDDLTIVLSDESGTAMKALPSARAAEDDEQVGAAKKDFAASKKQIAAAATEQPLRLHEAMCTQRRLSVDDFERYIIGHPVMRRLATRLVWAAETGREAGPQTTLFRPLSDATLLDVDDEEISIAGADRVRLAHEIVDGRPTLDTWREHLADYEIGPLFAQFDRPDPGALAAGQIDWTGCRGAIIDDRSIRDVMKSTGFHNGTVADAGNVITIERRFPAAGLAACVQVRGLNVEVFDTEVAIESLGFTRLGSGDLGHGERVPLAEVPPVLLAETIADVETIVAAGDGIDPNWERRVEW